jgi:hypothetical protein
LIACAATGLVARVTDLTQELQGETDVSTYYNHTIGNLLAVTAEVQNETDDRQLARRLSTMSSLALAKESVSRSRGFLSGARARGGFRAGDAERFASLIGAEDT